jgi:hypothetical protein
MDREPEAFPSLRTFQQTSNIIENAIAGKGNCINDRRTGMEEHELRREVAKFGNSFLLCAINWKYSDTHGSPE